MSDSDIEKIKNESHLLYEFIKNADKHRYKSLFDKCNSTETFINRMNEKGSFAQGLLTDNLGKAARKADIQNGKQLIDTINASHNYSIVSTDGTDMSAGFTTRTVPAQWVKETEKRYAEKYL